MSDMDQLLEMGFDKERAEIAIKAGGTLQGALDFLDKHADTPLEELQEDAALPQLQPGEEAKSLICNECGKRFRSTAQAEFHASKSEHTDFSESTEEIAPLTEAEKKAKLEELKARAVERKKGQSAQDKMEQKRNEEIRRKANKDQSDAKEELAKKQAIKDAQMKRQEQLDDIAAKKRIRDKIEQDKRERKERAEKEKAAREGQTFPASVVADSLPPTAPVPKKAASEYNETRLRLQTSNGTIQKSLPVATTLFEVVQMIQQENGAAVSELVQNFPRKVFSQVDFGQTLKEAGLVPSAALIAR